MKNDTYDSERSPAEKSDPLGLEILGDAVAKLTRLKDEPSTDERPTRWTICVEGLADAYDTVATKYELLRDRYSLLKRSNSQLHDELVWLRDQFDDLCSLSPENLKNRLDEKTPAVGAPTGRYADRWPR